MWSKVGIRAKITMMEMVQRQKMNNAGPATSRASASTS
jgi:hypothetical protein